MAIKSPTYKDLLEIALRAEKIIVERNTLEAKRKRATSAFTTSARTNSGSSFSGC